MKASRFVFLVVCSAGVSAAPGCAQIAGLSGDYRHATSGAAGAHAGAAGLGSGGSAATAGDSGASGEGGAPSSAAGGTSGSSTGTGGTSGGPGGRGTDNGGASTATGGGSPAAGDGSGEQGGEAPGAGGSAGQGAAGGTSGAAGAGGSGAGPVRIGYSEFHDSASGDDDASGHLVDVTFEKPADTQEGDLLLVFLGVDHEMNLTNYDLMMQGWTLLDAEEAKGQDGQGTYLIYRFAGADEPDSIVFEDANTSRYGVQGVLSVYRGVNRTSPVNAYDVVVVDRGTDGPTHIETPTPALATTAPNCLLLAGLSPDSSIDAPAVTAWPDGFGNSLSVTNPQFPRPYGWANIYLAERAWETPATFPAASIAWDIKDGTAYYGAVSFLLALAPER
jgi:hypothetical protein